MAQQERTGWIAVLYLLSGIGVLAIIFDLFNSILDGNEQIYYRAGLLLIIAAVVPQFFKSLSRSTKILISTVLIAAGAISIWVAFASQAKREAKQQQIQSTQPPLALTLDSSPLSDDQFAAVLHLKNRTDNAVEVFSYGAQNESYGYFRDVEKGALVIPPKEERQVSLGRFPVKKNFNLAVEIYLAENDGERMTEKGLKAYFENVANNGKTLAPTSNRPVDKSTLNGKRNFIATVVRFPEGTMDFNLTKLDPDGFGGSNLNTPTGNEIGIDYARNDSDFVQPGGVFSMFCALGGARAEAELPVTILSDQFDTPVKLHWSFPTRTCSLEVGGETRTFSFL